MARRRSSTSRSELGQASNPVMSSNNFQTGGIEESKDLLAMSGTPTSPPDPSMYPWNWCDGAGAIDLSPASSVSSSNDSPDFRRDLKRGRPRADAITTLIVEGTRVNSDIRCKICNRVFPRDKSLQAHMRTHTGKDVCGKVLSWNKGKFNVISLLYLLYLKNPVNLILYCIEAKYVVCFR